MLHIFNYFDDNIIDMEYIIIIILNDAKLLRLLSLNFV